MSAVASQWHWMDRGRKMGPVSWGELQALAKSGKLRPTDMVLRDGSTKWQPAQQARDADETPSQSGATVAPAPVAAMRPPPVPRVFPPSDHISKHIRRRLRRVGRALSS